jgi:hypothetical protein
MASFWNPFPFGPHPKPKDPFEVIMYTWTSVFGWEILKQTTAYFTTLALAQASLTNVDAFYQAKIFQNGNLVDTVQGKQVDPHHPHPIS